MPPIPSAAAPLATRATGQASGPIGPPATIGILGGGQLGRMIGFAARSMGYRLVVLDPDPECPAAAVADEVVVGRYDDVDAALALATMADVVTYELEHVSADLVTRLEWDWPVRPDRRALEVTQDRLAERRFLESAGASVAPWSEVHSADDVRRAFQRHGGPLRLKATRGGYDGRGQVRITEPGAIDAAVDHMGTAAEVPMLAERELDFEAELSVICTRGLDGHARTFPVARNRHDAGILVESISPAPIAPAIAKQAADLVHGLVDALDLVGTLTAELFLLRDGSLVVNELAPRVHNTGHWTTEACRTSQFEQHVRAICGLPLGSPDQHTPAALVNLLGNGTERDARVTGVADALADDGVSVHLYDKRRVFERRKMGHVVALDPAGPEAALGRARDAAARIGWA